MASEWKKSGNPHSANEVFTSISIDSDDDFRISSTTASGSDSEPEDTSRCTMTKKVPYISLEANEFNINNRFQDLTDAQNNKIYCFGYRKFWLKVAIYRILNVLLIGVPYLIGRWWQEYKIFFTCVPSTLQHATDILVKVDDEYCICAVKLDPIDFLPDEFAQGNGSSDTRSSSSTPFNSPLCSKPIFRHFSFRHETYVWEKSSTSFRKLEGLRGATCGDLVNSYHGLPHSRRIQLKSIYGSNLIDVEVKSYWKLFYEEIVNPFYVFQIFSITLWCFDNYYYYAGCIIIISVNSIIIALLETRRQMETLRDMATQGGDFLVSVRRIDGDEEEIFAQDLVPGDVLLIPPEGLIMPCDAVVTSGTCIVNESMLTGESIPVRKIPMTESNELYDAEVHKRHTIFAGTNVIQTRFYGGSKISCIVVRTGFSTLKGSLIRSIMFPKKTDLDFYRDAVRFVFLLFLVALLGMAYCAYVYIKRQASFHVLIVRVLDIVTIAVPPALPAALTIGIIYAQSRLKQRQIFCISPPKINFCGKLQLICFDKTGTLTEDGLDFSCAVPVLDEEASDDQIFGEEIQEPNILPLGSELIRGMASCHSLTHIKGQLIGDPLDLKMFAATGWELVEPLNTEDEKRYDLLTPTFVKMGDVEIGIIREFEFTPQLQRMSVVVKALDSPQMMVYCKGSPEKVSALCTSLPKDYDLTLDSYTVKGFRVLALACKNIAGLHWHQVQRVSREDVEKDMKFIGFLIMQNSLKPATNPVIKELKAAELQSVMVTGDNALTAISVARECGMIPTSDKVIIVNATEDGEVEFTLAAHHYEVEDTNSVHDGHRRQSVTTSHSRKGSGASPLIQSSDSECPPSFLASADLDMRLIESFPLSSSSSEEETRIDLDRLVPITPGENSSMNPFLRIESNYCFVVTGKVWDILLRYHSKSMLDRILIKGMVYARMSPEHKRQLIESLQNLGYVVGMVGDGANDCSALKMAHVGISLSDAEASVAAPFTSRIPDISCVPHLIREGRCALVTSFGLFKYMALYSIVQFISVLILYTVGSNLSDLEFLYIDLIITTTLAIVMGRTEPFQKIVAKRPIGQLASVQNSVSIFSQIVTVGIVQAAALFHLQEQPWYVKVHDTGDEVEQLCWENTTIFVVSAFQYLILALVFSKGPPFRKPFYTNRLFLLTLVLLTGITVVFTIHPFDWLANLIGLMPMSSETMIFRYSLIIFPILNLMFSLLIEGALSISGISGFIRTKLGIIGLNKTKYKYKYQEILQQIEVDVTWPKVKC